MSGRAVGVVVLLLGLFAPSRAFAAFHEFEIKEIYSNADGTIQYIELFSSLAGQGFVQGHTITANDGTQMRTFTFAANVGETENRHLLIATPGVANLPGAVTPDFTLPCGPFFDPSATSITITFVGADTVTFAGSALPKDGSGSLTDTNLYGTSSFQSGTNSPTNIGNSAGTLALMSCQIAGTCDACDDGMYCNGAETCSVAACAAGPKPCPKQCIEDTQTCVDCITGAHCADGNPCTDDVCNGANECENPERSGSCEDGLFCNGADTCVAGVCEHDGSPCGAINCNEGPDTCGDCTQPSDCEDGETCTTDACTAGQCTRANVSDGSACDTDTTFCNGVGTCASGVCGTIQEPCTSVETCDEDGDLCVAPPADAGVMPDALGEIQPPENDEGCCQTNAPVTVLIAPGLIALIGLGLGRRRRTARTR